MRPQHFYTVLGILIFFIPKTTLGQLESDALRQVNELIYKDSIIRAAELLKRYINISLNDKDFENAATYVYPQGKIEILENNTTDFEKAITLYNSIQKTNSLKAKYTSNIGLALLYNDQGRALKAYEFAHSAYTLANLSKDVQMLLESQFYLSEFGMKRGDFNLLEQHCAQALKVLNANPRTTFYLAPRVYNYKASIMHFTAKSDSANYYFQKAIDALNGLEQNPETQYYLPATIYGNWVMVKQSEGDYTMAMEYSLEGVRKFNTFLANTKNHPLTSRVLGNLSISYRDIGSLYNDMGDKQKAKQFAGIGYRHAKSNFLPNTFDYFNAALMMAEAHIYTSEPEPGKIYLEEAANSLSNMEGDNELWHAQLASIYAAFYFKLKEYKKAISYFNIAIENYDKSHPEGYDQNQLYNLMNLAKAYAHNKQPELAMATSLNVYEYCKGTHGEFSLLTNESLLSLAQVAYLNADYKAAIKYSQTSLDLYNKKSELKNLDKLFFEENKSWVLLLHAKSKYALLNEKNEEVLKPLILELEEAILLLEHQKSFASTNDDIGDLIANNLEVFDFTKKLYSDIYGTTRNPKYLNEIIRLHESAIYNRIRARLNLKNPEIDKIPVQIRNREKALKNGINEKLSISESYDEIDISAYVEQTEQWNHFLDSLKVAYPKYYKMRYTSIKEDISDLQQKIPKETTLVRYLFINDKLYAFIADAKKQELVALDYKRDTDLIAEFNKQVNDIDQFAVISLSLYDQLWRPITSRIDNEKVIIYPDGELFNLSFELLTPSKISSFKELETTSLLAKHVISYNYSLLLLNQQKGILEFEKEFVAYAPEFDTKMKKDYEIAITDTLNLDHTYLMLLPQPFSTDLIKKFTKRYKGSSFLNQNASKQIFGNTAKEHKIIHIGTHAESNNVSPELSRLVFAKNVSDTLDINDNYLYTYEIYNQDLSSNLAVLTACETGKPSYQPGEGMISLAHAFNYAGSESILTSLWEIDEQSSTQILGHFYAFLEEGLNKDEALRKAKLAYLKNAEGRTQSPQYWAGLILMGDTEPIALTGSDLWYWLGIGLGFFLLITLLFLKRKAFV